MSERMLDRIPAYLRWLYTSFGYLLYRTPAFEEYDLFTPYRDFLTGGRMITFSGAGGRLLALKPDITLSIIRDTAEGEGRVDKYYYSESVYRLPLGADEYKEILQIGLEAVGDLCDYDRVEAVLLACRTLAATGREYRLDISHTGLLAGLFSMLGVRSEYREMMAEALKDKNAPAIRRISSEAGLDAAACSKLIEISRFSLKLSEAADVLGKMGLGEIEESASALRMLNSLSLSLGDEAKRVYLDFSVVHSLNYYDGAVFAGYVDGISECLLRGGEYGSLVRMMGRAGSGIGFALYADLLERLDCDTHEAADIMLVCADAPSDAIARAANELREGGKSVLVQKSAVGGERCGRIIRLNADGTLSEVL